jgi:hypothetical protein
VGKTTGAAGTADSESAAAADGGSALGGPGGGPKTGSGGGGGRCQFWYKQRFSDMQVLSYAACRRKSRDLDDGGLDWDKDKSLKTQNIRFFGFSKLRAQLWPRGFEISLSRVLLIHVSTDTD